MAEEDAGQESESARNARLSAQNGGTVVQAVGTAVGRQSGDVSAIAHRRHKLLEEAMVRAVLQAGEDGVTDPDDIKAAKAEAYDAALAELDELGVAGYEAKHGLSEEE